MQPGTIIGIGTGIAILYMCHQLVGHVREGKTRKVILSLESMAVVLLFVAFTLGEVMRVSAAVNAPASGLVFGLQWEDFRIIFITLFTSIVLFLAAVWCLHRLGIKD